MKSYPLLYLVLLSLCMCLVLGEPNCSPSDQQFLVTFHPHLDAFWLNTDRELKDANFRPAGFLYAMNQRNSKTIFNSMLSALNGSAIRKYFVTESVFLKDWYDSISADNQELLRKLVKNGQLEIANGGWVENDEAVCYYDDILDQYTVGHNFLYDKLDYQTKIGWATDSFGHSHSQAALEHLLGFEFQGIERVDDRYVNDRRGSPLLEFYWDTVSDSNNRSYGGVLNHVRHFLHEVNDYRGGNVAAIKQDYQQITKRMKQAYGKNKLFRFLGNDFEEFITDEFVTLERVMKQLSQEAGQPACPAYRYGNPSDYLNLIEEYWKNNQLPVRKNDLIPNWDQDRYWTGYYTTDPELKKNVKDLSRLVNFYRKSLLVTGAYQPNLIKLNEAEQLLAVMQHHDGITATSKTYIQDDFRQRMKNKGNEIIKSLGQVHNSGSTFVCNFLQNGNKCQIDSAEQFKNLHIIAHGGVRSQRLALILPLNNLYDVEQADQQIFCDSTGKCTLLFQARIAAGVNKFTLLKQTVEQLGQKVYNLQQVPSLSHQGQGYSLSVLQSTKHILRYNYGQNQYFQIGLYTSPNNFGSRQSVWWDKYGNRVPKNENIVAGMYIMFNNGKLTALNTQFTGFEFAEGKIYKKAILRYSTSTVTLIIKNSEPNIIDVSHNFRPPGRNMLDYFLKVSSHVKSETLYHDANGFLVSRRELNKRPDYDINMKPEDAINGNTYPACSFAYLLEGDKKFVFFSDRAQGVAAYGKDLLVNFDRLGMDDGKGVGEGYSKVVVNTYRYRFAVVDSSNDIERRWQRQYDEGLLGYISKDNGDAISYSVVPVPNPSPSVSSVKYTIFFLNQDEIVLRLQNLAEFDSIVVASYQQKQQSFTWVIEELGLSLSFLDIRESYANGIVKEGKTGSWRKFWGKNSSEVITVLNQNQIQANTIELRPLEIRSFRINFKQSIRSKFGSQQEDQQTQAGQAGEQRQGSHLRTFRKRCF